MCFNIGILSGGRAVRNECGGSRNGPAKCSILREGVYTEIWTGELVKVLHAGLEGTWLSGIPDQNSIVNNDAFTW